MIEYLIGFFQLIQGDNDKNSIAFFNVKNGLTTTFLITIAQVQPNNFMLPCTGFHGSYAPTAGFTRQ